MSYKNFKFRLYYLIIYKYWESWVCIKMVWEILFDFYKLRDATRMIQENNQDFIRM